jgi:hydrogenase maturation factor
MKLKPGKLPVDILRRVTRYRGAPDPTVVVGPRFGEDAAVINLGDRYLILKSDPVTFTTLEAGWYVVHVNANDIAVMGGQPRWFQPTIIVPPGTGDETILEICGDIHRASRSLGIAVTGGHTEVSAAVRQPIVAGDMQGIAAKEGLITSAGARPGDLLVLTKSAGIEGTSILARELDAVARRVLGVAGQRTAATFHRRPGISVVGEASLAARGGATAMHDPTEGGVAMALVEMASASRRRFEIELDRLPIHPLTRALCRHLRIDPLGLIGSGSLLISIPPRRATGARGLLGTLAARGIPAKVIGAVHRGRGVVARAGGKRVPFRWCERDELTRVL